MTTTWMGGSGRSCVASGWGREGQPSCSFNPRAARRVPAQLGSSPIVGASARLIFAPDSSAARALKANLDTHETVSRERPPLLIRIPAQERARSSHVLNAHQVRVAGHSTSTYDATETATRAAVSIPIARPRLRAKARSPPLRGSTAMTTASPRRKPSETL